MHRRGVEDLRAGWRIGHAPPSWNLRILLASGVWDQYVLSPGEELPGLEQAESNGMSRRCRVGTDVQLVVDMEDVRLDRALAQEERLGDLTTGIPLRHHLQHLDLAAAQPACWGRCRRWRGCRIKRGLGQHIVPCQLPAGFRFGGKRRFTNARMSIRNGLCGHVRPPRVGGKRPRDAKQLRGPHIDQRPMPRA